MTRVRFLDGPHEGKTGHYTGPQPSVVYASDVRQGRVDFAEDPNGFFVPGELPHRYEHESTTPDGEYLFRYAEPEEDTPYPR